MKRSSEDDQKPVPPTTTDLVDDVDPSLQPSWNFKAIKLSKHRAQSPQGFSPESLAKTGVAPDALATELDYSPGFDKVGKPTPRVSVSPVGSAVSHVVEQSDEPGTRENAAVEPVLGSSSSSSDLVYEDEDVMLGTSLTGLALPPLLLDHAPSDSMLVAAKHPGEALHPVSSRSYDSGDAVCSALGRRNSETDSLGDDIRDQFVEYVANKYEDVPKEDKHFEGSSEALSLSAHENTVWLKSSPSEEMDTAREVFQENQKTLNATKKEKGFDSNVVGLRKTDSTVCDTTIAGDSDMTNRSRSKQKWTRFAVVFAFCAMFLVIVALAVALAAVARQKRNDSSKVPMLVNPSPSPPPLSSSPQPTVAPEKGGSKPAPVAPIRQRPNAGSRPSVPTATPTPVKRYPIVQPIPPTTLSPQFPNREKRRTQHPVIPPSYLPPSLL